MLANDVCGKAPGVTRSWRVLCGTSVVTLALAAPLLAQTTPAVTIGGGLQTSFLHTDPGGDDSDDGDDSAESTDEFVLNSIRLYVKGSPTDKIKIMFNTEYNGNGNDIEVLDAVARMEFSPKFNVWFGRFLPPSDRANLHGPYYSHHWAVYQDGVQDGYPFIFQGRANGAMYWGQFGIMKLSGGVFDGNTLNGDDTMLSAGRVQLDFWDPEDGYYLNGTYYGDKNLLAIGAAGQVQGEDEQGDLKSAFNVDFLLERKVSEGGAFSIEAEWAKYSRLGGYDSNYGTDDGGYVKLSVQTDGISRLSAWQVASALGGITPLNVDYDQTTELDFNYDQAIQCPCDDVCKGHAIRCGQNRLQAGRRRGQLQM